MRKLFLLSAASAAVLSLGACASLPSGGGDTTAAIGDWGIDLTAMDTSVAPGDDFFRYVNGAWLDSYEIPADRSRSGTFITLRDESEVDVHSIVAELAEEEEAQGSVEQKVGDFYNSWMNVEALDARGLSSLQPRLDAIAAIDSREDLMVAFGDLHATTPFGMGIIPDPADTTHYIIFIGQGGLGLPDRDYYLKEDERFADFRTAYHDYVVTLHDLAGIASGEEKAGAIIALETRLAQSHWTQERSREITEIYNPMSRAELAELAPQIDWNFLLDSNGLESIETMVVTQTTAIAEAAQMFEDTPLETWKSYLTYHLIRTNAAFLPSAFDDANFDFYSSTLRGVEEQRERWKRGVQQVNANMGEAVGQVYISRFFPASSKTQMDELVANLRSALEERLQGLEWMDDETRAGALLKLSTFEPRIGYTESWTDYTNLEISDDLLANAFALTEFQWGLQVDRLDGPVDKTIWPYPPQTVNASYNPLANQITFPAGILQAPFFDPNADPAVNYGAIGAVIGHEIGHGFDDQGRRFDELGRIRDWWTEESDTRFSERADMLVEQYDGYSPVEDANVNGRLTLGENIGDLGGLQMAWSAWQRFKAEHGEPEVIDGFTGDQRFFLSFGQIWRGKYRDDAVRQQVLTDPHSPSEFRANGPVRNFGPWYEAFGVTEDHALYLPPAQRVSIW